MTGKILQKIYSDKPFPRCGCPLFFRSHSHFQAHTQHTSTLTPTAGTAARNGHTHRTGRKTQGKKKRDGTSCSSKMQKWNVVQVNLALQLALIIKFSISKTLKSTLCCLLNLHKQDLL